METLGSLIDKLTIANNRLWHLEDIRRDKSLPDSERLEAADKVSEVNMQRNNLIDEIDEYVKNAIRGEIPELTFKKHKLYETRSKD